MSHARQRQLWLTHERYRARFGRRYPLHWALQWRYKREWLRLHKRGGRIWLPKGW